jgi:GNAT superfamily N-acetyltransferase
MLPQVRIDLRRFEELSEHESEALASLRGEIDFGTPPYEWTPAAERPWRFLVWDDDRLVAHVGVMDRTIRVGGEPLEVAGVYSVMTRPADRGKGYASAALRRAAEFMRDELPRAQHGLLVCIDERVPFYGRLGWQRIDAPVEFDQPGGRQVNEINTMVLPLRGRPWPAGDVDLCGLPW